MNREETIEFLDDEETEERIFTLKYKIETTTEKLEEFKKMLEDFPLIVAVDSRGKSLY